MKAIFLLSCFIVLTLPLLSQHGQPNKTLTQEEYLEKSKSQKTLGYTFLGVGVPAVLIPTIIVTRPGYEIDERFNLAIISFSVGAVMMVSGVILIGSSAKYKRKAMSLSLKNETSLLQVNSRLVFAPVPSLSLKISL